MAIEKVVTLRVQDDFTKTETTVKSLRAQLREATANVAEMSDKFGATSREATEAAKRAAELKDQIGDARALTDAFNPDAKFKALTGALAGVSAGFAAYQGMLGVAGVENAELEKQILKVQSAMAVTQGLQTIGESVDTFKQLGAVIKSTAAGQAVLTAAQSAYTFVVGASTTALKALRIALISTGVGALVVGLGMLIANFEKISNWVGNLIEKFGGWRNVLAAVSLPIWAIVKALEAMGIIESEAEEKSRKADEAKAARKAAQAKQLEKDIQRVSDFYDFEIAKAEASGKSTIELERKKRNAILEKALAMNEAMRAQIAEGKATEEEIKRWNENQKIIIQTRRDATLAELKNQKEIDDKRAEANRKAREDRDKQIEKEKEARRKELEDLREFQRIIAETNKAQTDNSIQAEIEKEELLKSLKNKSREDELYEEYKKNQAILDASNATESEYLTIQADYISKREALQSEADQKILDEQNRLADEQKALREAELEHKREVVQASLDLSASFGQTLQNLAGKNKAIAKIGIVIENAAAIARIVQNTAVANAKAVNAFPLSGGQPWVGINIASGVLGIANTIAATRKALSQIGEGGDGGGAPSMSGGGGGAAPAAPQFNIVGQNANNQLAATIAGQQGQPIRTYVVGQEVTTQQSLDRQIRTTATFNS